MPRRRRRSERSPIEPGGRTMPSRLNPYVNFDGNAVRRWSSTRTSSEANWSSTPSGSTGRRPGVRRQDDDTRSSRPRRGFTLMASDGLRGRTHGRRQHLGLSERWRMPASSAATGQAVQGGTVTMPSRSRCGATRSACAPIASASPGWSTSPGRLPPRRETVTERGLPNRSGATGSGTP